MTRPVRALVPGLDGLGAQHQVREVDVPLVRRHVRALRPVAHVAQVAVVHHLRILALVDAGKLAVAGGVDEVEQRREGLAQAESAPAPVADVEDAPRWPWAWPVSPSAVERNTVETSL
jgi:hypothetical protein